MALAKHKRLSRTGLIGIAFLTLLGGAITWRILAATSSVVYEAENASLTGKASKISNAQASGGQAVMFGESSGGTGGGTGGGGTTSCSAVPKTGGGNWACTFSDEFDGAALDASKWEVLTGKYWGNACYVDSPENMFISGGNITLRAIKTSSAVSCSGLSNNYSTAAAQTQGKFSQKYGRFEMRAKLPAGQGMWPAFWMMPEASVYGGWPQSGEIDIMEALGHETNQAHATLHWANSGGGDVGDGYACPVLPNYSDGFHTYTLEWAESSMTMLFDGTVCHTFTSWDSPLGFPKPFDQAFYFIINLSVGGEWPGEPNDSTPFPGDFVIDYIRAWQ